MPLTRFSVLVYITNRSHIAVFCWVCDLIFLFLGDKWFLADLDGESSKGYPINADVPHGSILPDHGICNVAISLDNSLYSRCDGASHLRQQPELTSELKYNL